MAVSYLCGRVIAKDATSGKNGRPYSSAVARYSLIQR